MAPPRVARVVVAFDIADNRRRRRAVAILEAYGQRVLESVFECWLEPQRQRSLTRKLLAAMRSGEDLLAIHPLPAVDAQRAWHIGCGPGLTQDPRRWILCGAPSDET
ncbi:CRISPR-associated endonuclease Cas2 [Niveibacterium sp. COAC-50]|uniref:CRISPR-associated endonuclease Cas2 n=1 Tax=Niveibacterium sp. COAC-50 TaxID=2729384 RepID=UPI001554184C|nr:CRISPR-associated endonuclease Cas2 [Niveibacterium sp. COAC-50]